MTEPTHALARPHHRVLVVDACRDGADSCAILLRLYGHDTRVARTCADALRVAVSFVPDVVLSEMRFPDGDGFGLAERLVSLLPRRPALVAHSGHTFSREDWARARFDLHLHKPADPAELVALVASRARCGE